MIAVHPCLLTLACLPLVHPDGSQAPSAPARPGVEVPSAAPSAPRVPVAFEANRGQAQDGVSFLQRGAGYTLQLGPRHATFQLGGDAARASVRMLVVGPGTDAVAVGRERLRGVANYYRGADSSAWIAGVPTFARVECQGVYPGVDLVYHGDRGRLQYDFVVAPGARPEDVRLAFEGAARLELDGRGALLLRTPAGVLEHGAPTVFQEGPGGREAVAGRFVRFADGTVGFEVGDYDRSRPLVIDPTIAFSRYLGGSGDDSAAGVATDAAGNVYVAGYTSSADFPGAPGAPAGTDAFVTKLDASGAVVFTTFLGGASSEDADGVGVDAAGNVLVAGNTQSGDFPVTGGAFQASLAGGQDFFVAELDPLGALAYSTYVGGSGSEAAFAMAAGPAGDVYVAGRTSSADLPVTSGAFDATLDGAWDATLAVVSPDGNGAADLLYMTYLGGGLTEQCFGVAVDSTGAAYLTGSTTQNKDTNPRFPTTPDAYLPDPRLRKNQTLQWIFLSKILPAGGGPADLAYSTHFMENPGLQSGRAVAADDFGRAYVAGVSHDGFPTTAGAFDTTYNGGQFVQLQDVFVAIVDTDVAGAAGLEYATYLGGYDGETPEAVAVEGASPGTAGTVHVAGVLIDEEPGPNEPLVLPFPLTGDAFRTEIAGSREGFYAKIEPAGNGAADLRFSTFVGGSQSEIAWGVAVDGAGAAHLAGQTDSTDFAPLTAEAHAGGLDAFVMRVEFAGGGSPPAAPTELTATATSSSTIDLAWTDNASDEDGFDVERSPDGSTWSFLAGLGADATGYGDTGLAAGTTYHYRVRAYNAFGTSAWSNIATATTPPDGGGGDAFAGGEVSVAGTVTGDYTDTHASDDVYESIVERESGGKPSKRTSYLEHKWTFQVPASGSADLHVEAYRSVSPDGDDFVFSWSTDDASYEEVYTLTKTADDHLDVVVPLGAVPGGTVYVRVQDTDRTQGNRDLDTVHVDRLYIHTE